MIAVSPKARPREVAKINRVTTNSSYLPCHYCGRIRISTVFRVENNSIVWEALHCGCYGYPIWTSY